MADYVSSLTGVAMDMALQDMAEHNSEAWAVGQRNGNPVTSDDVTYHNNAQYYAQQAQSIAPASVTEAVRWDIAQTALTDANKEQARSNIDAGKNGAWSNDNLLDNAYFVGGGSQLGDGVFPINQRGLTSYTSAGFVFDRWFKSGGVTATLDAGGLTIANSNGWPDGINQRFPMHFFAQMNGQAITASVLYADGSVDSGTAIIDATQNYQWLKYPEAGEIGFQLKNFQDGTAYDYFDYISFGAGANSTPKKIKAFKLELGTVSTLANDPTPDFGEELRKCQRYLFIYRGGYLGYFYGDGASMHGIINTPAPFRAAPSVSFTSNGFLSVTTGAYVTSAGSFSVGSINGTTVQLNATLGGSVAAGMYVLYVDGGQSITFSAEL